MGRFFSTEMSLISSPPPYKSSERIAHYCPEDAMRYYKPRNDFYASHYQSKPVFTEADRRALALSERKARQTPTYESHLYTKQEAFKISPSKAATHKTYHDDMYSCKTERTGVPRNVLRPEPDYPKGALALDLPGKPREFNFKGKFDPNRHGKKTFLECDVQSVSKPIEIKHKKPKCTPKPTPRHLPHNVKYEKPGDHVITLKLNEVSEKVNLADLKRSLADEGH